MTSDLILSPDWQNTITSSGSWRKNNGTRIEEIEEGFAEDELSFGSSGYRQILNLNLVLVSMTRTTTETDANFMLFACSSETRIANTSSSIPKFDNTMNRANMEGARIHKNGSGGLDAKQIPLDSAVGKLVCRRHDDPRNVYR